MASTSTSTTGQVQLQVLTLQVQVRVKVLWICTRVQVQVSSTTSLVVSSYVPSFRKIESTAEVVDHRYMLFGVDRMVKCNDSMVNSKQRWRRICKC